MLTVHELAAQCTTNLCNASGLRLSPRSGSWMTCILSAGMACLPTFIEAFITCIGGPGGGSDDQYKPGERQRCD